MTRRIPSRPFNAPASKAKPARHEVSADVREAVWRRCGGLCEACGQPLGPFWHAHHRKLRKQGGDDSVTNVLALHGACHRGVHAHPARSYEAGFLVKSHEQPGRKQLALHFERWVRLARDASYVEAA